LLRIAREIQPEIMIPVHSEQPELYVENLKDPGMEIVLTGEHETVPVK